MRNVQGICLTIFAFHGGATRPSTMAKDAGIDLTGGYYDAEIT